MIQGIAYDMDGTLTRPVIDFGDIRQKLGISDRSKPIYETILAMPATARERSLRILEETEISAAQKAEPNPGLEEMVKFLSAHSIKMAIYTRNSQKALELTMSRLGLNGCFAPIITRDHNLKLKPEPDMILHILDLWHLQPEEALVVGDYEFDIMAGKAAKCRTIFINHFPEKSAPEQADFVITRLDEIIEIVKDLNAA